MRAQQLQQQLVLNAQVLTGLYEEYSKLRKSRKEFNAFADEYKDKGEDKLSEDYSDQAELFTPYIRKFKRKIASIEQIQKALKHELKSMQALDAWQQEDDAWWLAQAELAREEGFVEANCNIPPVGWYCTRDADHDGPCAAWPVKD